MEREGIGRAGGGGWAGWVRATGVLGSMAGGGGWAGWVRAACVLGSMAGGGGWAGWVRAACVLGSMAGGVLLLAGGAGVLVGCSSAAAGAGAGATCGTTRTAADVPVVIKVIKGTVNCGTAMQVENEYAAKIRAGQVQGNGGGAPVSVSGWTCQGYPTTEVLSTGDASQCHTASAAIVAVLPVPTPGATSTTG